MGYQKAVGGYIWTFSTTVLHDLCCMFPTTVLHDYNYCVAWFQLLCCMISTTVLHVSNYCVAWFVLHLSNYYVASFQLLCCMILISVHHVHYNRSFRHRNFPLIRSVHQEIVHHVLCTDSKYKKNQTNTWPIIILDSCSLT